MEVINSGFSNLDIIIIIKSILYSNYSLWFLRTLSMLYMISPIIKWIYSNKNRLYLKIMLGIIFVFPFLYNYVILIFKLMNISFYNLNKLPRTGLFTMYSILYFVVGGLLSKFISSNNKNANKYSKFFIIVFVIGIILSTIEGTILTNIDKSMFDGVNSSFPTIGAMCMSFSVFYIVSGINIDDNSYIHKIIEFIGKNAIGIYIFHLPFVYMYRNIIGFTYNNLIVAIFITTIIVIISSILNSILVKIPIFKYLLKS